MGGKKFGGQTNRGSLRRVVGFFISDMQLRITYFSCVFRLWARISRVTGLSSIRPWRTQLFMPAAVHFLLSKCTASVHLFMDKPAGDLLWTNLRVIRG